MDLKSMYCIEEGSTETTFSLDENLPALPLPKLDDTLQRYYESLKPFGTADELANSKKIIDDFRTGVGAKLQVQLEERAKTEKNWVAKWWEDYAYFAYRMPLLPYCSMIQPLCVNAVAQETHEQSIKNLARTLRYNCNLWDLARSEQLKPTITPDGQHCSSKQWKHFYSTVRIPGEVLDEVHCHFKTIREGPTPTHIAISGDDRIFILNTLNPDGTILTYQQFHQALHFIYSELEVGPKVPAIPLLTCDDRTTWARNRQHLINISPNNKEIIKLIEESHTFVCLDDREPADYSESGQMVGIGHSRWADKSSILVQFRNGRHGCIGEHSCYDGTLSISFNVFLELSFLENPEPNWNTTAAPYPIQLKEYRFDVDAHILSEVARMEQVFETREHEVILVWNEFGDFGKQFLKSVKIHPDAFIQMMFQLTYYKLHKSFPATYETALMRYYYNGRTETVRSCSARSQDWVLSMFDERASNVERFKKFKIAIENQNRLMREARTGKGIDRHLFGLWCSAYESGMEIHPLYADPLYGKSGGGGNFALSTSCLGYTLNAGYVAPMLPDGYGAFYSITDEALITLVAVYRKSPIASATKFTKELVKLMREVRDLIDVGTSISKL